MEYQYVYLLALDQTTEYADGNICGSLLLWPLFPAFYSTRSIILLLLILYRYDGPLLRTKYG